MTIADSHRASSRNSLDFDAKMTTFQGQAAFVIGVIDHNYITGAVTSSDDTAIGYRKFGEGPSLVLLHGSLCAAQHLMDLGRALAGEYTVYIPDRRGRGASAPIGSGHCLGREMDDLTALLFKSRAKMVFGTGTGALIVLQALLRNSGVRRAALYEPMLDVDGSLIEKFAPVMRRYERQMAMGNMAEALTTVLKGGEMMPDTLFRRLPNFMIARSLRQAIQIEKESALGSEVDLETLIPTQRFDYMLMVEAKGSLESFRSVGAEVLLMGGSRSPAVFKKTLDELKGVIPYSSRVELKGMGHAGPAGHKGEPERVAEALRKFFGARGM